MNMQQLFDDFKERVESLDDDAIKQSIDRAVEDTSNGLNNLCVG